MQLSNEELDLTRQWFDAVQDLNPKYLEPKDFALARQLYEHLGFRVPNSLKQQ